MEGNNWNDIMAQLAAMQPSASGWDGGREVISNGQRYRPGAGYQTNADGSITYTGGGDQYVSAIDAPWAQGQMGNLHDASGNVTQSWELEDPAAMDWQEKLILAALAAGGGAAAMGLAAGASPALGSLGGLGGVAEAGTAAGMMGGAGTAAAGAGGTLGLETVSEGFGPQFEGSVPSNAFNPNPSWPGEAPWSPTPNATPLNFSAAPGGSSFMDSARNFLTNPKNLMGLATTALGAASGAAGGGGAGGFGGGGGGSGGGGSGGGSGFAQMDPRLDPYVFGSLLPNANFAMQNAIPRAQEQSAQMAQAGSDMLNRPIAGNGVGQVQLNAPNTPTNPYLSSMADDMGRRTQDTLGQAFGQIRGNAVGVGGLGGSRQGVAEGIATKGAADSLQGQLAGLYGNAWNADANRAMSKYTADQGFYGQQRAQDMAGAQLGSGLLSASQDQLWQPMKAASDLYRPYTALPSSSGGSDSKNSWQSVAGGLLSGASLAGRMGLWG